MRPLTPLSDVQLQVLQDVARGLSNLEIANRQHRSPETIRSHLKNIYHKLRARNRANAVAIAYHVGIFRGVNQIAVAARPLAPTDANNLSKPTTGDEDGHATSR